MCAKRIVRSNLNRYETIVTSRGLNELPSLGDFKIGNGRHGDPRTPRNAREMLVVSEYTILCRNWRVKDVQKNIVVLNQFFDFL